MMNLMMSLMIIKVKINIDHNNMHEFSEYK